ncbi:3'-5' exonuclease (plasmid) [Asticcacaulis sp. DW145]|uniref:3'-5' exonuclease n=1 Tax=unclassified Asticcacaulis TaxID=2628350 RepID=UPI0030862631|nr:3'-5' exonuclease [Asticcacaulis sp. DW145]
MASQLDMFGVPSNAPVTKPVRKPKATSKRLSLKDVSEDDIARHLEMTGRYRILRQIRPRDVCESPRPGFPLIGAIVDTETTGLNKGEDEVIEIGVIAFRFNPEGQVGDVIDVYSSLHQPSRPIPSEITALTGITDEMVRGRSINLDALERIVLPADLIIAHNAGFDRPFCERLSHVFASKPWACSNEEVDWKGRGFEGTKLGYLINQAGFFHNGHRAVDDCFALLEVLLQPGLHELTPFAELYRASQRERIRIWAEYSPFDKKDVLKARGYRWSGGEGATPKAWWTEVDAELFDSEIKFLEAEIYNRSDVDLTSRRLTAVDRFKG